MRVNTVMATMDPSKWKNCKNWNFMVQILSPFSVKSTPSNRPTSKTSFQPATSQAATTKANTTVISRSFLSLVGSRVVEICVANTPVEIITARARLFLIVRITFRDRGLYRLLFSVLWFLLYVLYL